MSGHDLNLVSVIFEDAASTLRRISVSGIKPNSYFNNWPDIIRDIADMRNQDSPPVRMGPPSAERISQMEEVIGWLFALTPDERRLIWMRAEGIRWRVICYSFGMSKSQLYRKWQMALEKIANLYL